MTTITYPYSRYSEGKNYSRAQQETLRKTDFWITIKQVCDIQFPTTLAVAIIAKCIFNQPSSLPETMALVSGFGWVASHFFSQHLEPLAQEIIQFNKKELL